jgi:hypothetical protein
VFSSGRDAKEKGSDTTGRGKNAWSKRPNRPIKEVLGYPLTPHFRQLLAEV